MKLLTIKDNSFKENEICELCIPNLIKQVANKTLKQLADEGIFVFPEAVKNSNDLVDSQMILRSADDKYFTENVMGFLGYKDERLIINSRFSDVGNDYFLQYMLSKVLDFPNVFNLYIKADSNEKIIDLLTFMFPHFLQTALRKGLFKTYMHVNYNNSNPKGTINIAHHIKKNLPFLGKIAYCQREFSYDNYLIELIRHTIEFIKTKQYGKFVLNKVKDDVKRVIEATPKYQLFDRQRVIAENKKHPLRHAYYYEYGALQNLCLFILQNQKLGFGAEVQRVNGILFDGAWLWEEYLNTLVAEWFYHPRNKSGEGAHSLFQGGNGRIYPDFIGKNIEKRIISDAKYKPFDNIKGNDYFQILAYMMRFDSKQGFYFYPENDGEEHKVFILNYGSHFDEDKSNKIRNSDIKIIKLGLKIPKQADDYDDFSEQMQQAEEEFKADLINAF